MAHDVNDLGVALTLVSFLHRTLVEDGAWPSYLVSSLLEFANAILSHPEPSVRTQGLSLLATAVRCGCLSEILHARSAPALQEVLQLSISSLDDPDDDEREDLDTVTRALGEAFSAAPALNPRALQRLVLDLLDARDRFFPAVGELDDLATFVKERALLDDAGDRVLRDGHPLQTLRVVATETTTRIISAIQSFAEAVVRATRDPEFAKSGPPDYGLRISWAPAASVSAHLSYAIDNDARVVFGTLEKLSAADRFDFDKVAADVSPIVAAAFVRLIERLRQHDDKIEIVLTDPDSTDWQRRLTLRADILGGAGVSALMRRTRSVARGSGILVAKEDVPQANTVRQVFQAVDAMLDKGIVTEADIDGIDSRRQANYYLHGARVLGLFDEDNQPTGRARSLIGRTDRERMAITAVYFEDSPIGRAWRDWAGADHLYDVEPATALAFLETCVRGLSGDTPGRRASTLRAWFAELMPHYPGRSGGQTSFL
jgi:hypothetical protein